MLSFATNNGAAWTSYQSNGYCYDVATKTIILLWQQLFALNTGARAAVVTTEDESKAPKRVRVTRKEGGIGLEAGRCASPPSPHEPARAPLPHARH